MPEQVPTLEALCDVLLNPARPRFDEVMAVPEPQHGAPYGMRGQRWMAESDQRLARAADRWESMISRGILPEDWADDPRRRFSGERCVKIDREGGTMTFAPVNDLPHPGSVDDVLTFACDPMGMLACEELARVMTRRLVPWSAARWGDDVVWRTVTPANARVGWMWFAAPPRSALERALTVAGQTDLAVLLSPAVLSVDYSDSGILCGSWQRAARSVRACALGWREAVKLDLKVPTRAPNSPIPAAIAKKRFADLEDPFAPLLDILSRGYFVEEMYASICLAAHAL